MVLEYRVNWTYGSGAPGVSVLHGRSNLLGEEPVAAQGLADRARALFAGLAGVFNETIDFTFPSEVAELDTATGVLTNIHIVDPGDPVAGNVQGGMAGPAGAVIRWDTPAIVAGRRLRGRTFLVPLTAAAYVADGSLDEAIRGQIGLAAANYIDNTVEPDAQPCVWSRTHGILADITAYLVVDDVAVLRSRRD